MTEVYNPGVHFEALPKQFVSSLRILFDILDENRCGYVRLTDIEQRWQEGGVRGLPSGVVEALRRVTPVNGFLSFERFVSGLRLAMTTRMKQREDIYNGSSGKEIKLSKVTEPIKSQSQPNGNSFRREPVRQTVAPVVNQAVHTNTRSRGPTMATVRPNNVLNTNHVRLQHSRSAENILKADTHYQTSKNPTTSPPQTDKHSSPPTDSKEPPKVPPRDKNKSGRILNELKNWQRERMIALVTTTGSGNKTEQQNTVKNFNPIYVNIEQIDQKSKEEPKVGNLSKDDISTPKKPNRSKPLTPRRHTLADGVDTNMIKKLKQLDEERKILIQGIMMVEKARDWYNKQLKNAEDKQKFLQSSYNDSAVEAGQEKLNFQTARIMEVNNQLKVLIESSEKGSFPMHMNLAVRSAGTLHNENKNIERLKEQNRQLTKEVGQKDEKITQLEREKATLIRELFESKSKHKNYDDTTFM